MGTDQYPFLFSTGNKIKINTQSKRLQSLNLTHYLRVDGRKIISFEYFHSILIKPLLLLPALLITLIVVQSQEPR